MYQVRLGQNTEHHIKETLQNDTQLRTKCTVVRTTQLSQETRTKAVERPIMSLYKPHIKETGSPGARRIGRKQHLLKVM